MSLRNVYILLEQRNAEGGSKWLRKYSSSEMNKCISEFTFALLRSRLRPRTTRAAEEAVASVRFNRNLARRSVAKRVRLEDRSRASLRFLRFSVAAEDTI